MMTRKLHFLLFSVSLLSVADAFRLHPPAGRWRSSVVHLEAKKSRRSRKYTLTSLSSTALASNFTSSTAYSSVEQRLLDYDDKWLHRETLDAYLHQQQSLVPVMPTNSTVAMDIGFAPRTTSRKDTVATPSDSAEGVSNKENDITMARVLLLAAAALYGTNFSVVKLIGDVMPVGISTTIRFGLAAVATLPWLVSPSKKSNNIPTEVQVGAALAGLEVGLWNSIGYIAQAVGLETTEASKSAFLCSLAVVIVPMLDYALAQKKLKSREWMGAILAVCGVGFLELGGGDATNAGGVADVLSSWTFGDFCSLLQPLAFGIGFWRMEAGMRKYPSQAARSTAGQLMAVFLMSVACLAFTTVTNADVGEAATIFDLPQWVQTSLDDPMVMGALIWTGVVTTAFTVWMETVALKTLSAAETTLIFSTEPLWGTACACVLMGEHLGMSAAAGALLIVGGCIYSNLGMKKMTRMLVPGVALGQDDLMTNISKLEEQRQEEGIAPANSIPMLSALGTFASTLQWSLGGDASGDQALLQQASEEVEEVVEIAQEILNAGATTDLL